jgi:hypothetical protein
LHEIVLPLAALLVVAALVRIVAWSRTAVLFNDGPVLLAISDAVGEGRWGEVLAHPYHPLYPVCIRLFENLGLAPENAAVAVSVFGALIGIIALHSLLRRTFSLEVAWLGAWLLVLHPWAIDFSADVMTDGLYLGLYLSSFAALARLVDRPSAWAASVFAGSSILAFLVRPEALGLLMAGGFILGLRIAIDPAFRGAARRPIVVLMLVTGLGLMPYVGWLSFEAGALTFTQKKSVSALVRGEPGPAMIQREPDGGDFVGAAIWLPQSAGEAGVGQPSRSLRGALEAVLRVVRTSAAALRYEVLPFVAMGLLMWRRQGWGAWRAATFAVPVLLYSGLLVLLVWGAGYVSRRHALPALVPLLGFSALAWQALGQVITSRWEPRGTLSGLRSDSGPARSAVVERSRKRLVCGALVVVLALAWGPRDLRERRSDRVALREAAEWIGSTFATPGPVAAEKLRMAYYAGAAYVPLRADFDAPLEATLLRSGASFVLVDGNRLDRYPGVSKGVGAWLREIHRVEHEDRSALVFEIVSGPAP